MKLSIHYPSGAAPEITTDTDTAYGMADSLKGGHVITITDDRHRRVDLHPGQIERIEIALENGGDAA